MRRDGPLGVRGMPARVSSVDETAIQAKLRELRVAMARERTARTEVNATMEANGGRIWSSSRPSMLRSRDGGLKLRELTAEELERIQRAKDRAAVSDRAAAISAVTAGSARNRSGRRLDPLNSSVISSASASARSRPGSASTSRPQTPKVEHVVVRATSSVYAPPASRNQGYGTDNGRVPQGSDSDRFGPGKHNATIAPRPPAAPAGARPASRRRPSSGRALKNLTTHSHELYSQSDWQGEWHPDANDMIEPMGDPAIEHQLSSKTNAGGAEVLTFCDDVKNKKVLTTASGVQIVNETPSLLDGSFDERANQREFAEALREWRGEGEGEVIGNTKETRHEIENDAPSGSIENSNSNSTGSSLLDGDFDERANQREFQQALREWRGDTGGSDGNKNKAQAPPAMETQTDSSFPSNRKSTSKPVSTKTGASYFERLYVANVGRLAGKHAVDAMTRKP